MRDHVTEDRISAYLDGELDLDERLLVEQQLAESEDLRVLFEDLRRVRSQLQALPKVKLANDLASRVVQQIEQLKVSPGAATVEPQRRPQPPRRWRFPHPWRSPVAILASVATVVIIAFSLPRAPEPPGPGPIETTVVEAPVFLRQQPKLLLVYDVTVSPAGDESKRFFQLLKTSGVGFDPDLKLDGELESELIAFRGTGRPGPGEIEPVPFKNDLELKASRERVEMVYLTGGTTTIGRIGKALKKLAEEGDEIRQMRFEMTLEPKHVQVFKRLHNSAQFRFAQSKGIGRSDLGVAFGLQFSIHLTSLNVPEVASFSGPRLDIQVASTDASEDIDLASGPRETPSLGQTTKASDKPRKAELAAGKEAVPGADEATAVLVILRYPSR